MSEMASVAPDRPKPEWLAKDDRWLVAEKIANSDGFRRSARLREFLLYVVAEQLDGHPEEITEHNIGYRVFKRSETYNPAEDNIVRVSARQLRLKLKEYYGSEGRNDPWIIEIPKGAYIPQFRERKPLDVQSAAQKTPEKPRKAAPAASYWVLTIVVALTAGLVGWVIPRHKQASQQNDPPSPNLITAIFGQSPSPVHVIVSDPILSISQSMQSQRVSLSAYSRDLYANLPSVLNNSPEATVLWNTITGRELVNIGDVQAAIRFGDALAATSASPKVAMLSAASIRARGFRSGNFILMGASDSDPWVNLFNDDRLSARFVSEGQNRELSLVATDAKSGKQHLYIPKDGVGYARIALVPNLTGTGKVLLIAGTSMESTESAASFCLDSKSPTIILSALHAGATRTVPYFEAILRTYSQDGTGLDGTLITAQALNPGTQ